MVMGSTSESHFGHEGMVLRLSELTNEEVVKFYSRLSSSGSSVEELPNLSAECTGSAIWLGLLGFDGPGGRIVGEWSFCRGIEPAIAAIPAEDATIVANGVPFVLEPDALHDFIGDAIS